MSFGKRHDPSDAEPERAERPSDPGPDLPKPDRTPRRGREGEPEPEPEPEPVPEPEPPPPDPAAASQPMPKIDQI